MKVIAKVDEKTYVCIINHIELEKFFDLYYRKMNMLHTGDEVDLGAGHDYYSDIVSAFQRTIETNQKTIQVITNGLTIIQKGGKEDER